MMFLKSIDGYGSIINFTLNNQLKLNSNIGGIFTILTIIIYFILINLLATDYYLKINPKVTSEKVFLTDTILNNYKITNNTFLFAIDNPEHLKYPKLFRYSLSYIKQFDNLDENITNLSFISCNQTNYSKLFTMYDLGDVFYCFDISEILNENLTN